MSYVMKNLKEIKEFRKVSKEISDKLHLFILLSQYTGIYPEKILALKVKDLRDKDYIYFKPESEPYNKLLIHKSLKPVINAQTEGMSENDLVFRAENEERPMSVDEMEKLIFIAGERMNLNKLTIETPRRTFFYEWYRLNKRDIGSLCVLFDEIKGIKSFMELIDEPYVRPEL